MNLSINGNGGFDALKFGSLDSSTNMQASSKSDLKAPAPLTITEAVAAPEDIAAAEIPDAALSRDDALGKLVGAAFSLPPPALPDFASNT